MKRIPKITKNWLALAYIVLFSIGAFIFDSIKIDYMTFDLMHNLKRNTPSEKIVLIEIDEKSLSQLGRWPWQRKVHAQILDRINDHEPRSVTYLPFFFEPYINKNFESLQHITNLIGSSEFNDFHSDMSTYTLHLKASKKDSYLNTINNFQKKWLRLKTQAKEELMSLDEDELLGNSFQQIEHTVLPVLFDFNTSWKSPKKDLPTYISSSSLSLLINGNGPSKSLLHANNIHFPIDKIGDSAYAFGHVNAFPDVDGKVRSEKLVINYYNTPLPSISLATTAASMNIKPKDILVVPGHGIQLNNEHKISNLNYEMHPYFYQNTAFPRYSFSDILNKKITNEILKDKIIIVGATANGVGNYIITPRNSSIPSFHMIAHSVSNLLEQHHIISPNWAYIIEYSAFVLSALFLAFLFPNRKAITNTALTFSLISIFLACEYVLFSYFSIWIKLTLPSFFLALGYFVIVAKNYISFEKGQDITIQKINENSRILGLTYQSQGLLDLAFDQLKQCKKSDDLVPTLYNLGLDFERKRQYSKAANIYEYITSFSKPDHELLNRISTIRSVENSVNTDPSITMNTVKIDKKVELEKPTFGRYKILRELGRGGMGIVYLAEDPKINRSVAIKTLDLSEFDQHSKEINEYRARFLNEAESIGKLNHRNIVSIYDYGEEHDMVYIAMEYILGKELTEFIYPDSLLSIEQVVKIGLACSEALDYAHKFGIVHRDIKPSNVIFDPDNRSLKITDFGIAAVLTNRLTQTSSIVGSQGYMSPEQVNARAIDGRSDIFSLGTLLYQLLTAEEPFYGNNFARYVYKLSFEKEKPLHLINKNIDLALSNVIAKAMEKLPENRFQTGLEMRNALESTLTK